jgi:hypothetical protein
MTIHFDVPAGWVEATLREYDMDLIRSGYDSLSDSNRVTVDNALPYCKQLLGVLEEMGRTIRNKP